MKMDDFEIKAFDIFNLHIISTPEEKEESIATLLKFYGQTQSSTFEGNETKADPITNRDSTDDDDVAYFFQEFESSKITAFENRNKAIKSLIKKKELKVEDAEQYKIDNPILSSDIYKIMIPNAHLYPDIMKIFKISLLIPPSTANVERGFSVLTMIHTKYRNSLTSASLDKLMRLILIGEPKMSDEVWEEIVDLYDDKEQRRI